MNRGAGLRGTSSCLRFGHLCHSSMVSSTAWCVGRPPFFLVLNLRLSLPLCLSVPFPQPRCFFILHLSSVLAAHQPEKTSVEGLRAILHSATHQLVAFV